jgi:hypothetical protein
MLDLPFGNRTSHLYASTVVSQAIALSPASQAIQAILSAPSLGSGSPTSLSIMGVKSFASLSTSAAPALTPTLPTVSTSAHCAVTMVIWLWSVPATELSHILYKVITPY